jgi:hypothetical protein
LNQEGFYATKLRDVVANMIKDESIKNVQMVSTMIGIHSVIERDWQKRLILEIMKEAGRGLSTEEISMLLNERITKILREGSNDYKPLS